MAAGKLPWYSKGKEVILQYFWLFKSYVCTSKLAFFVQRVRRIQLHN